MVKDRLTRVAEQGELPLAARSHTRPTQVRPDAPPAPQPDPEPQQDNQTLPLGAQQLVHSFALANLAAELQEKLESHARQPRRKYISAETKEYRYASYMEGFRAKVERVGNLNYPEEARRRQIYGEVMLDVALNSAGKVVAINVRRSSGKTVLDDAARRIVGLAAPYDPLPAEIREEVDELHITRIWKFDKRGAIAASR